MKSITPFGNMFNMITRDPTDKYYFVTTWTARRAL